MKALLKLTTKAFETLKIEIDPCSLRYYGNTEDYDYKDKKSYNTLSFVLADSAKIEEVMTYIKGKFQLMNSDVNDYVTLRTEFDEYTTDKRPRITIWFKPGSKGWSNPPEFYLEDIK